MSNIQPVVRAAVEGNCEFICQEKVAPAILQGRKRFTDPPKVLAKVLASGLLLHIGPEDTCQFFAPVRRARGQSQIGKQGLSHPGRDRDPFFVETQVELSKEPDLKHVVLPNRYKISDQHDPFKNSSLLLPIL